VQALRNTLDLIRNRLGGLSPAAKLLAGSLMVIVAMGLFLVAQWSATVSTVPFTVTPTAYEQAKTFLANRGVTFTEENGRLMVPTERYGELLAGFAEQGGGSEAGIDFNAMIGLDSPFSRRSRRRRSARRAMCRPQACM